MPDAALPSVLPPFRIVCVCTGNVARSPFAARLLRGRLDEIAVGAGWLGGYEVTSRGARALTGEPMVPEMVDRATRLGLPADHAAAQLVETDVAEADLVLGLERSHRGFAVQLHPVASRVSYTLVEFARLADDALAEGLLFPAPGESAPVTLGAIADVVGSRRGLAPRPEQASEDDIDDPYHGGEEDYDLATERIAAAVERIAVAIATVADPTRSSAAPALGVPVPNDARDS